MAFTTFIIPTIGRPTLSQTVQSLLVQQDPDFKCIIAFDGLVPTMGAPDERFRIVQLPFKFGKTGIGENSFSGNVRNYAMKFLETDWMSFVDDDDTVTPDYVHFLKEAQDNDVVIFRMCYNNGRILPPPGSTEIIPGLVGISFSVRKTILDEHNLRFPNNGSEDYEFLSTLQRSGVKMHISPHIAYRIRH